MTLEWFGLPLMVVFAEGIIFGYIVGVIAMMIWGIGYFIDFKLKFDKQWKN